MIDFDYYKEYSRSIKNKLLLWQCLEKQIFIQLTFPYYNTNEQKLIQNFPK